MIDIGVHKSNRFSFILVITAESNNQLYIGDEEFQENIKDSCSSLLNELLNDIQQLGANKLYRLQVIAR